MTSLEYAQQFAPGSRNVTIRYGRIQGYRSKTSWGFELSDESAADMWYKLYTCARRSAKRLFNDLLKPHAEQRGFKVRLVVDAGCGLTEQLDMI